METVLYAEETSASVQCISDEVECLIWPGKSIAKFNCKRPKNSFWKRLFFLSHITITGIDLQHTLMNLIFLNNSFK